MLLNLISLKDIGRNVSPTVWNCITTTVSLPVRKICDARVNQDHMNLREQVKQRHDPNSSIQLTIYSFVMYYSGIHWRRKKNTNYQWTGFHGAERGNIPKFLMSTFEFRTLISFVCNVPAVEPYSATMTVVWHC